MVQTTSSISVQKLATLINIAEEAFNENAMMTRPRQKSIFSILESFKRTLLVSRYHYRILTNSIVKN